MSLPTSQQRALDQIEKTLTDDHPGLGPLFATFTRLVGNEAMPVTERVTARPRRRRMWPTIAALVGLALVAVALFTLSLTLPGRPPCTGTVVSLTARTQPLPTGSQAACATHQGGPSTTSPAKAGDATSAKSETNAPPRHGG